MIVLVRKEPSMASPLDNNKNISDQSHSPLFALPAELRNRIWSYLLIQDSTSDASLSKPLPQTTSSTTTNSSSRNKHRFCANILRTCKRANAEGTPILYGENVFSAHTSLLTALPSFLLLARPNRRVSLPPVTCPRVAKMIRRYHFHLRLDTDPRFSKAQVEESFTGVEELEIEVFQSMYQSCDFSVLSLFEAVRGVGKAIVQGSVGDGKYAEWLARSMMSEEGVEVPAYSELYLGGDKGWDAWVNGNR